MRVDHQRTSLVPKPTLGTTEFELSVYVTVTGIKAVTVETEKTHTTSLLYTNLVLERHTVSVLWWARSVSRSSSGGMGTTSFLLRSMFSSHSSSPWLISWNSWREWWHHRQSIFIMYKNRCNYYYYFWHFPRVCVRLCVCLFSVPGTASVPFGALPSSPPARYRADPSVRSSLSARPATPTPLQSQALIGGSLHCSDWWTRPLTCGHPSPSAAPEGTSQRGEYLKQHLHVGQEVIFNNTELWTWPECRWLIHRGSWEYMRCQHTRVQQDYVEVAGTHWMSVIRLQRGVFIE